MRIFPADMRQPTTPAGQLAAIRWAKATDEERKAHGQMLKEARERAKELRAQKRVQAAKRRSRKPRKPQPKA